MSKKEQAAQAQLKERYMAATDSFIDKMRDDPNVIAVIISGSLAYDLVWEKSDIDMTIVVRDQPLTTTSYCMTEDGVTINASLMTRSAFKRGMERNLGGSFSQSYFAKGRMVYTTDDSLLEYFEELKKLGSDDIAWSLLGLASELIGIYHKCQKWMAVRKDSLYAQYYLLKAAETIAHMELCLRGEPASRQSIQKAVTLNPAMMAPFYQDAMSRRYSEKEAIDAIAQIDRYLEQHLDVFAKPVLEFMSDGEMKTVTLISKYFRVGSHFMIDACEYLADKGIIEKAAQTIRITPKSKLAVEEMAYLYIP